MQLNAHIHIGIEVEQADITAIRLQVGAQFGQGKLDPLD
jgi:hypothetical protein